MGDLNRQQLDPEPTNPVHEQPVRLGHPSFAQMMAEQGTGPITDLSEFVGKIWPDDESTDEFLKALYEWRGRMRTGPVT